MSTITVTIPDYKPQLDTIRAQVKAAEIMQKESAKTVGILGSGIVEQIGGWFYEVFKNLWADPDYLNLFTTENPDRATWWSCCGWYLRNTNTDAVQFGGKGFAIDIDKTGYRILKDLAKTDLVDLVQDWPQLKRVTDQAITRHITSWQCKVQDQTKRDEAVIQTLSNFTL